MKTARPASARRCSWTSPTSTGGLVVGTGDLSRAGPGLGHLQRRPHEHVRRERRRAQNAGAPPRALRSRHGGRRGPDAPCCWTFSTPLSAPSCCPPRKTARSPSRRRTLVGPYELHDFYLYYVLRFGFGPAKIYRLARHAFAASRVPGQTCCYKWLRNFYRRFFAQQFKRSCLPDGPKVGIGDPLAPGRLADAQRRSRRPLAGRAGTDPSERLSL